LITEQEVDRALAYLRDQAEADAQARAERLYLEQFIKTVLAQEMAKSTATSIAASEVGARVSVAYGNALLAFKQSIHDDEKRRFLRSAAEARIDAWRTQESSRRAEGKAYS
jgi:hypothetical protein